MVNGRAGGWEGDGEWEGVIVGGRVMVSGRG